MTPAQAHYRRLSVADPVVDARRGAILAQELAALRQIQSDLARKDAKTILLAQYRAYLDGVLRDNVGVADPVVGWATIWALDCLDPYCLDLLAYCLRHNLAPPAVFRRSWAAIAVETVSDAVDHVLRQGQAVDGAVLDLLTVVLARVDGLDLPDPSLARGYRALGLALIPDAPDRALEALETALHLYPRCGVLTTVRRIRKITSNVRQGIAPGSTPPTSGGGADAPPPARKKR